MFNMYYLSEKNIVKMKHINIIRANTVYDTVSINYVTSVRYQPAYNLSISDKKQVIYVVND